MSQVKFPGTYTIWPLQVGDRIHSHVIQNASSWWKQLRSLHSQNYVNLSRLIASSCSTASVQSSAECVRFIFHMMCAAIHVVPFVTLNTGFSSSTFPWDLHEHKFDDSTYKDMDTFLRVTHLDSHIVDNPSKIALNVRERSVRASSWRSARYIHFHRSNNWFCQSSMPARAIASHFQPSSHVLHFLPSLRPISRVPESVVSRASSSLYSSSRLETMMQLTSSQWTNQLWLSWVIPLSQPAWALPLDKLTPGTYNRATSRVPKPESLSCSPITSRSPFARLAKTSMSSRLHSHSSLTCRNPPQPAAHPDPLPEHTYEIRPWPQVPSRPSKHLPWSSGPAWRQRSTQLRTSTCLHATVCPVSSTSGSSEVITSFRTSWARRGGRFLWAFHCVSVLTCRTVPAQQLHEPDPDSHSTWNPNVVPLHRENWRLLHSWHRIFA